MSKRNYIIAAVVVTLLCAWWYVRSGSASTTDIIINPKRGTFEVSVTVSGELQAKNSIEVQGPTGARAEGIWQMKIDKLIAEGSVVKLGEWVADLDKSEIASKMKDAELGIQKAEAQYTQTSLDSALALANARDEITNLTSALEEHKLQLEQSAYEPPAIKRQTEIAYQTSGRQLKQAIENYQTKYKQAVAKMSQASAELQKERKKFDGLMALYEKFSVMAPANGMVVYAREWNGKKKAVGSQISSWDPTVATLPDLTQMQSVTYVNEVDIQKVRKDQHVSIGLDADPNKKLNGTVIEVANIGEQRPNTDSKVFEVKIQINDIDTLLRPAMTTSNRILVSTVSNSLYVPLECLHAEEGKTFVFMKNGSGVSKQEVKVGSINENEALIEKGLSETDKVFLSVPGESAKAVAVYLK